eukprot:COSAG01_NODE_8131_length_2910_cov_25.758391_2_plen_106_part_00
MAVKVETVDLSADTPARPTAANATATTAAANATAATAAANATTTAAATTAAATAGVASPSSAQLPRSAVTKVNAANKVTDVIAMCGEMVMMAMAVIGLWSWHSLG